VGRVPGVGCPAPRIGVVVVAEPMVDEELEIKSGKTRMWARLEQSGGAHSIVLLCGRAGVFRDDLDLLAVELVRGGLTVLTVDLISTGESEQAAAVSDAVLHRRVDAVLRWIARRRPGDGPVGLLGTGSSAAWVLWAAGARAESVRAVVTVGGHPDQGHPPPRSVSAPVLMLIERPEHEALERARELQRGLHCVNELRVLPSRPDSPWSTRARELSRQWFTRHMADPAPDETGALRIV
jgi:hypothetical protein